MTTNIEQYITNDYQAIQGRETIADVQDFFEEVSFSHFPVLHDSVYIGSLAADDVAGFDADKTVLDYRYATEGFFVRNAMTCLDVLEVFAKNNTNTVPVLDDENNYLGYYEQESIIGILNQTPFIKERGGIIVVQKSSVDYSMSQIAQIVESNNGKILGLFISTAEGNLIEVTIKLAIGEMNEIIQSFRRYNYEIISSHEEDTYLNNLKDRSDYLDKYLNI